MEQSGLPGRAFGTRPSRAYGGARGQFTGSGPGEYSGPFPPRWPRPTGARGGSPGATRVGSDFLNEGWPRRAFRLARALNTCIPPTRQNPPDPPFVRGGLERGGPPFSPPYEGGVRGGRGPSSRNGGSGGRGPGAASRPKLVGRPFVDGSSPPGDVPDNLPDLQGRRPRAPVGATRVSQPERSLRGYRTVRRISGHIAANDTPTVRFAQESRVTARALPCRSPSRTSRAASSRSPR